MSAAPDPSTGAIASPVKALFAGQLLEEVLFPFPEPAPEPTGFPGSFRSSRRRRT